MPEYYTSPDGTRQVRNYKTPNGYYSGAVSGIPITSTALTPTQPFQIPQQKPDTTPYNQLIAGGNAFIKGSILPEEPQDTSLASLMRGLTEQPSSTDLYNQAYNASGIDFAEQEALAKRRAVRAAQAELGGIQSELQAVADSAKQQNLQLEQSINQGSTGVGGAGALASGSFLNVRQQEINRQAAIASLPLQAKALAASAKVASLQGDAEYAQSTLGMAQEKLNTTFKLMSEDSSRKQDLQMKMFDVIYNVLNKKEQARVDEMKSQITTNQSSLSDARNFAQTLSASALSNGQADIAAQLTQIPQPDVRSKTFASDLQNYNNEIARLQGQIRPKAGVGGVAEVLSIADAKSLGVPYGTTQAQAAAMGIVPGAQEEGTYRTQLADTGRQAVFGLLNIAEANPGIFGKTAALPIPDFMRSDAFRNYKAQLDYLKGNIIPAALTAMREASKTGGALGQVSDREGAWLASSLGALEMTQSPEQVKAQLRAIDAHLASWQDAVKKYGGGFTVTAPDGTQIEIID